MTQALIVVTPEELRALIRSEVRDALASTRPADAEVMTCEQAAELVKLHPGVLARFARAKRVPAVKIGQGWRFRRSELLAWMSKGRGA